MESKCNLNNKNHVCMKKIANQSLHCFCTHKKNFSFGRLAMKPFIKQEKKIAINSYNTINKNL